MTMAVQQRLVCDGRERWRKPSGIYFPRQEFFETEAVRRQFLNGGFVQADDLHPRFVSCSTRPTCSVRHRRQLVPEGKDATRFEPNHRDPALHKGQQRVDRSFGLDSRLLNQPCCEESPPATEWARAAILQFWQMHAIPGARQHCERSVEVARLEI